MGLTKQSPALNKDSFLLINHQPSSITSEKLKKNDGNQRRDDGWTDKWTDRQMNEC